MLMRHRRALHCDGGPVRDRDDRLRRRDTASRGTRRPGRGRLFGVTFQTLNNPFFVDLNEGLEAVVEAHGDRLVTLDAQFNSLKQKNDISDLLQQKPAAIFLNPVNWEGIRGSLIEAKRKNVPVIVVDTDVSEPDLVLCQVASDNIGAGRLAARPWPRSTPRPRSSSCTTRSTSPASTGWMALRRTWPNIPA